MMKYITTNNTSSSMIIYTVYTSSICLGFTILPDRVMYGLLWFVFWLESFVLWGVCECCGSKSSPVACGTIFSPVSFRWRLFRLRVWPVSVRISYDLGSVDCFEIVAGFQRAEVGSFTLTTCPGIIGERCRVPLSKFIFCWDCRSTSLSLNLSRSGCVFWIFVGRLDRIFLLNNSSPGDGRWLSMGVARRLSIARWTSVFDCFAFLIVCFTVCTCLSMNPFDWG